MAETIDITGVQVKIRSPWGVFFLSLITFGIYYFVWYYKTNKELQLYTDVSPGTSLLAITLGGFLIIPPFAQSGATTSGSARPRKTRERRTRSATFSASCCTCSR